MAELMRREASSRPYGFATNLMQHRRVRRFPTHRGMVRMMAGRCGRRERDFTEREEVPLGCIRPYGVAVG